MAYSADSFARARRNDRPTTHCLKVHSPTLTNPDPQEFFQDGPVLPFHAAFFLGLRCLPRPAGRCEVVFDLTKDGTNTARLTCPYSLSKGVATTFGGVETPAEPTPAPVETTTTQETGVNPWWLLLPLGLGLLSWAALRGKKEDVVTNTGTTYSGSYTNTSTVTTGTTTSRNIFVEANAHDGQLEVREHADVNSAVLRRVRNGENVQLTGHRRNDWLEVANGGWVRDIDVRYDRTTVRFS
jgi:hypothetical protein